jgi:hypothetical protein
LLGLVDVGSLKTLGQKSTFEKIFKVKIKECKNMKWSTKAETFKSNKIAAVKNIKLL